MSLFGLGRNNNNAAATNSNNNRVAGSTFRPKKNTPVGSKGLQLKRHIDATLGQGDLARAVALPAGEDLDEWLAVNVVDFYNAASVIYSTLAEFCTPAACPVMSAGSRYEYLWPQQQQQQQGQQTTTTTTTGAVALASAAAAAVGGQQQQLQQQQQQHKGCGGHNHAGAATAAAARPGAPSSSSFPAADGGAAAAAAAAAAPPPPAQQRQRPLRLCAPEYIERLFDWIEAQIDDERLFPQQFGEPFPPGFRAVAATVLRRLFRVYAHAYHSHFRQVVALGEEAHLNTCFKHFALFVRHFGLVDARELAPLSELIEQLCGPGGGGGAGGAGGGGSAAVLPGVVGQNGGAAAEGAAAAEGGGGGAAGAGAREAAAPA